MIRLVSMLAIALLCGCQNFPLEMPREEQPAPAPGPETAPAPEPETHPYAHMQQRQSFTPMSSVELKGACYNGNFVCGRSQLQITGAGVDETIIHGNLVLKTQCKVSNLTVTGDVIFEGNQGQLTNVDFFGRIVDNGLQNRY